jgi:hypothetical protein
MFEIDLALGQDVEDGQPGGSARMGTSVRERQGGEEDGDDRD